MIESHDSTIGTGNLASFRSIATLRVYASASWLLVCLAALLALAPAAEASGPPLISDPGVANLTETSATLQARLDPTGLKAKATFLLTPLASFKDHGFEGAEEI